MSKLHFVFFEMKKFSIAILFFVLLLPSFAAAQKERGNLWRDLNKNGKKDIYEDSKQPVEKRVDDLIRQMTISEKAGLMFINGTFINSDGTLEKLPDATGFAARLPSAETLITEKKMNHFNFWEAPGTENFAKGINAIQKIAEKSRLGIPVTIASDPRHYFSNNIFTVAASSFSQWPQQLGFAAIGEFKDDRAMEVPLIELAE